KNYLERVPWIVLSALKKRELEKEKRILEERLRQNQKIEAISRLTGGIAHDFNNLLTAIAGYSALIADDTDSNDPRRPDLDEIKKAADRAAALTKRLLTFSHKQVLQPQVIQISSVLARMSDILRCSTTENIDLSIVCDPRAGSIKADPSY